MLQIYNQLQNKLLQYIFSEKWLLAKTLLSFRSVVAILQQTLDFGPGF
jgi:DNA-binding transcriptional regulator YhcF (GntR family)